MTPCDECGEETETRSPYAPYPGMSHHVCQGCYETALEPDTGRPDWEDLDA